MAHTCQILKTIGLLSLLFIVRAEHKKHDEHKDLNGFLRPPSIDDTRHTNLKTVLKPVNVQNQDYNHREKKHLQDAVKQNTERPSFMSQITSWLFPFGGNSDSSSSASEKVGYGPPNIQQHNQDDCNPCNLEPWIPVPKKTIIGFVPPQQYNSPTSLISPQIPSSNYGPPKFNGPNNHISHSSNQYGSTNIITQQSSHISSQNNLHGNVQHDILAHSNQYGPPVHNKNVEHVNIQSISHINGPEIFNSPSLSSQYGPPSSVGQHVGNINLQSSIPIADSQYGPSIVSNVPKSPPLHLDAINPPNINYGPPSSPTLPIKPINQYGSPKPIRNYGPPKEFLGPPTNLRPVPSSYFNHHQSNSGHNSNLGHHSNSGHQIHFGSQTKHSFTKHHYHHNGPNTKFGPPPQFSQRPPKSHGPPEYYASVPKPLGQYGAPFNKYSSSQSTKLYIPAKFEEHPILPPKNNKGHHLSTALSATSSSYGPPVNNFHPLNSIGYGIPDAVLPTQFTPPKIVTPTSEEYIPPPHQLPLENSPLDSGGSLKQFLNPPKPIPFPNLHHGPLPPLHKAQPFYSPLPPTTIEIHETDDGNYNINSYQGSILNSYNSNPTLNQKPIVHNDDLIKDVISSLPESTDTVYGHHHHHDTSISETVNQYNVHNVNEVGATQNSYGISQDSYHLLQSSQQVPEHQQKVEDIQVVPSVSVAEYTSSVEYPINLIQSPLVDIIATENKNEDYDEQRNIEHSEEYLPPANKNDITTAEANQHSALNQQSSSIEDDSFSLSKNPIIVEGDDFENEKAIDTYISASTRNETIHKEHNIDSEITHHNSNVYTKQENLLKNHKLNEHTSSSVDPSLSTVSHTSVEIQPSLQTSADGSTIFSTDVISKLEEQIYDHYNKFSNHKYDSQNVNSDQTFDNPESPLLYLNPNPPNKASKEFNFVTPISNNVHIQEKDFLTPPTLDYSSWVPSPGPLSTSMVPPAPNAGGAWISPIINTFTLTEEVPEGMTPPPPLPVNLQSDEKKNKKIQIIIPYTSNSRPKPFENPSQILHQINTYPEQPNSLINHAVSNTKNPVKDKTNSSSDSTLYWLTQPQSDYHYEEESKQVTATQKLPELETSTASSNINDLLGKEKIKIYQSNNIPFDVLRLQQNIDKWTVQEFSNLVTKAEESDKSSTLSHLIPSKKIPHEYLTTTELSNEISSSTEATTKKISQQNFKPGKSLFFDYEVAGTFNHLSETNLPNITVISNLNNTLYESNLVIPEESKSTIAENTDSTTETLLPETTLSLTTDDQEVMTSPSYTKTSIKPTTTQKPIWEKIEIAISPLTNEKVYVVTPQPWNHDETTPASAWNYIPKHLSASKVLDLKTDELGFNSPRFSIRPSPSKSKFEKKITEKKDISLKTIFNEWPQAINNLETTTSKSSTREKISTSTTTSSTESLLWGLMDITAYTPPPGSSVEIHSGHSKITK